MTLFAIVLLPLVAAVLCWIPGIGKRAAALITLISSVALLALAIQVAARVVALGELVALPNWLEVDAFGALILLLVSGVGVLACIYSLGYMPKMTHNPSILHHYYGNFNLFIFSMVLVPVVVSPSIEWLAVEFTTLLSVLLVGFESNPEALEAAWKYAVLTLTGASIALFGFLLLFWAMQKGGGGSYTWAGLAAVAARMPPVVLKTAFLMILVGFGAKVGLVPLHTWLPDAHSQAPTPICALLSGVETTAVLYVILRLMPIMRPALGGVIERWAMIFGLLSVGVAAFLLIQVHDYKRLFAYSTVEHMGIILTAAGFGGAAAHYGAMYQIVAHAATKSFCFFAAGAVLLLTGKREIASIRGLMQRSRLAGSALLVGALAIAGAPPFVVFLGEFSILRAGIREGHYVAVGLLAIFLVVAFFGILLHVNRMVFSRLSDERGVVNQSRAPTDEQIEVQERQGEPAWIRVSLREAESPMATASARIPEAREESSSLNASRVARAENRISGPSASEAHPVSLEASSASSSQSYCYTGTDEPPAPPLAADPEARFGFAGGLPWPCVLTLLLAAIPVVVLGVYVPYPLYELLSRAAAIIGG
jgi:hydrogenase-4 component F